MDIISSLLLISIILILIGLFIGYKIHTRKIKDEIETTDKNISTITKSLVRRMDHDSKNSTKIDKLELERLIRKAEFGNISEGLFHDLINPLTSISLYLEKLENCDISSSRKSVETVATISKNIGKYMLNIKHNMGDICEDRCQRSNIQNSIETAVHMYQFKTKRENITINIENIDDKILEVPIHHLRLNQVFTNLISNAIDSFPEKQQDKTIDIECKEIIENEGNKCVLISISDNGSGIEASIRDNILKKSVTNKKDGTGIGLISVRDIIEKELGGNIYFESTENIGTTFYIKIPIVF